MRTLSTIAVGFDGSPDAKAAVRWAFNVADDCGLDAARVHLHVANGDACSVLIRMADDPISADLLVVGSRGQGKHPGLLLGSTSLELAEHATIPLVIVPSL